MSGFNNRTRGLNTRVSALRTMNWRQPPNAEAQALMRSGQPPSRPQVPFYPYQTSRDIEGRGIRPTDRHSGEAFEVVREIGGCTLDNPSIIWTCGLSESNLANPDVLGPIENICRESARRMLFKCAVIRAKPHSTMLDRAEDGSLTTIVMSSGAPGNMKTKPADWHLTVFFGDDFAHCKIQGHIFLLCPDPSSIFDVYAMDNPAIQRKYPGKNGERCAEEYWCVRNVFPRNG
ncbi:hypothetical protein B0T25DRAFT_518816 [Lasiosphaeria hispida]|uniref:Uncharacterized protein n=1 Tax=Lasiosphaeria hispida TaxID=260671 RepID=A0AAJ0HJG5_9PEZI|nr:hypothetical protein B0T25DRAFT_518816 [Lasiosphaeria hispida]